MTIGDLIKSLESKDKDAEIEFIIVKTDAQVIGLCLEKKIEEIKKMINAIRL